MKQFWEVFLPDNIEIFASRYSGRDGTASISFSYPDSTKKFKATFIRQLQVWMLDDIVEL